MLLAKTVKKENNKTILLVTSYQINDALDLYDAGADYVVLPHFLGGHHVSLLIEDFKGGLNKILKNKIAHIKELKERHLLGHEHPRNESG